MLGKSGTARSAGDAAPPPVQAQLQRNKQVARRIVEEVIDGRNLALADELFAPDYVEHNPSDGLPPGLLGLKAWIVNAHRGFPDWQHRIEDMIAEGDRVVVRTVVHGTHRGEWLGIAPTGRQVRQPGIDIFRIVDGRVVEHWGQYDWLQLLKQLAAPLPIGDGAGSDERGVAGRAAS
jgi:predicted ester cyclase